MVYDTKRGKVVLFGGNTSFARPFEAGLSDDTWEGDGRQWTEIKVRGPAKHDHNNLIYDVARSQTILYGRGGEWRFTQRHLGL